MSIFWKNVKDCLSYECMLNKELAAKANINLGTLNNQISADKLPDLDSAYKISQVLNVSLEYLLTGKTTNKNEPQIPFEDAELLNEYHQLSDHDKKVFKTILATMNKVAAEISPDDTNYVIVK